MPEINPLTNNQIFLKKIAENTGSDYDTGDVSEINPMTIDQIFLKEIAANTAGQSGDIAELEEKVSATQDMISDAYDSTHTYNVGDYCIYENALYKCNTASTTGIWDYSKWDAVTVSGELEELSDAVNRGSVSVTADGVKTYKQIFNELFLLATYSKICANIMTVKLYADDILPLIYEERGDAAFQFGTSGLYNNTPQITFVRLHDTNSKYESYYEGSDHDLTDSVAISGRQYTLYF